ncbi:hypothetical protein AM1_C0306 (plasmid) [Acaryochloris marina MBIC11017]|uniref:Uncharacterized protein n=1 Tax=Acaryochloris marina (strain MBIC 11017) TaxID=329726 RepID=A8ZN35_ACAM1|nr:hypothetical protein AM1_C0306 [Acaryochloris marina MBIC11017]
MLSGDCREHLETGAVLSPECSEEVHQMMLRRVHLIAHGIFLQYSIG